MTRRAVLGTGIAATALAAVPVLAVLPQPDPDADLIAACDDWHECERRCIEAFNVTNALNDEGKAKEPPVPAALSEELDLPPDGPRGPRGGKTWDPRDLKTWVDSGKMFHAESSETIEAGDTLTIVTKWLPLPEATRIRAAELLVIHERHKMAKRLVWAKYNRLEKVAIRLSSESWDRMVEISEIPAFTIGGIHAKMKVLNKAGMFENYSGDMHQSAQVVLKDVARLAEAVQS